MIGYLALAASGKTRSGVDGSLIDDAHSPYRLHGYPHPTVFKTVHNALDAAGHDGCVLILDLTCLPILNFHELEPKVKESACRRWMKRERYRRRWNPDKRQWENYYPDLDAVPDLEIGGDPAGRDIRMLDADGVYREHQLADRQAMLWTTRLANLTRLMNEPKPEIPPKP